MHQQNDNATAESQSQIWNALKKLKPIVYNRLQIHNSPAKNADRKLHIWIYEIGCIISSKSSHIASYKSMLFFYHDHTSNVDHINWTKKQCINQMKKHHIMQLPMMLLANPILMVCHWSNLARKELTWSDYWTQK